MTNLDALGAGAKLRNIYGPAWRYSHGDLEKEKVAEPVCDADIRCISPTIDSGHRRFNIFFLTPAPLPLAGSCTRW